MLKLNSRVHSWVTRQENEFNNLPPQLQQLSAATGSKEMVDNEAKADLGDVTQLSTEDRAVEVGTGMDKLDLDRELQVRLKEEVTDLYNSWDEAEAR